MLIITKEKYNAFFWEIIMNQITDYLFSETKKLDDCEGDGWFFSDTDLQDLTAFFYLSPARPALRGFARRHRA